MFACSTGTSTTRFGRFETIEQRVNLTAQIEKTAVVTSERGSGDLDAFGDSPIVRTGVVPHDEGVFLDLLGDEADQIFAHNAHSSFVLRPWLPRKETGTQLVLPTVPALGILVTMPKKS